MLFEILDKVKCHRAKGYGDVVMELHNEDLGDYSIKSLKKYLRHRGYEVHIKRSWFYLDDECTIRDSKILLLVKVRL